MFIRKRPSSNMFLIELFLLFSIFYLIGLTPASFIVYIWSFQTNIITIFTTNKCDKMSIQHTVSGFEPTTLWNMSLLS